MALNSDTFGTAVVKAIAKGGTFAVKEVQINSPLDDVIADSEWLTDERICGGNPNLENVTDHVYLPEEGEYGSAISWQSSDVTIVALDGTVTRPRFNEADKQITLTAIISKGDAEEEKTFTLTVKAFSDEDEEALADDMEWLTVSKTLGENDSQYSIKSNLELPYTAHFHSTITWQSNKTAVISDSGNVTRPGCLEEHQSVTLTATLEKGAFTDNKTFEYTVLSEVDTFPPGIVSSEPEDESENVIYNNRVITVNFDENIAKGEDWEQIKAGYYSMVRAEPTAWRRELVEVGSSARIDGDKLIVTLDSNMESLKDYRLIVPGNAVEDSSGNNMSGEFVLDYKSEKVYTEPLQVVNANPPNQDTGVDTGIREMTFNYGDVTGIDLSKGDSFDDITLSNNSEEELPVSKELNGNTITLELDSGTDLKLGEVYKIQIPAGAVQDRFKRTSGLETIRFRTKEEKIPPEIRGIYPADGEPNCSVNQTIDISFSEMIFVDEREIRLLDDKGNRVPLGITSHYYNGSLMVIEPIGPLEPETKYTVSLPENSIHDSSVNFLASDYESEFTTGSNSLAMRIVNKSHMDQGNRVDPVQIYFSSPVNRGPGFDDIEITDSQGIDVNFQSQEADNNVYLVPQPDGRFEASETYTVKIPAEAYKSENNDNELNDTFRFKFTTMEKLNMSRCVIEASSVLNLRYLNRHYPGYEITFSPDYIGGFLYMFPWESNESDFEMYLKREGREITSYEWTITDAEGNEKSVQNGKTAKYKFTEAGLFQVTLELKDSCDFAYELETIINVSEPVDTSVSISPSGNLYLAKTGNESSSQRFSFNVDGDINQTSNWKAFLYKGTKEQGNLVKELTVDTFYHSWYGTTLGYNDLDTGDYQLVIQYKDLLQTKEVREAIRIGDSPQSMEMEFYDTKDETFIDEWTELEVNVNGKSMIAKREPSNGRNLNPDSDDWYEISNISTYGDLEIEVFPPSSYPSVKKKINIVNSTNKLINLTPYSEPEITNVEANYVDYIGNKYVDSGVPVGDFILGYPRLHFEIGIEGGGHYTPKLVEFRTPEGETIPQGTSAGMNDDRNSYNATITTFELEPGEEIQVRVVSTEDLGLTFKWHYSPWKNVGFKKAPNPPSVYDVHYNGRGQYYLFGGKEFGIEDIQDGRIIGDIPLLDKAKSFGLSGGSLYLPPKLSGDTVEYASNRSWYLTSAGFTPVTQKSSMAAAMAYKYDSSLNYWKLHQGEIKIAGGGGLEFTKNYNIPGLTKLAEQLGIDVSGYITLQLNMEAAGTFILTNGGDDYEGILYFMPNPEIIAGVGHSDLHIEGYCGGTLASEVHTTGYVQVEPEIYVGARWVAFYWDGTLFHRSTSTKWDNGKEKVDSILALAELQQLMTAGTEDFQLTPMSREYLQNSSIWLVGKKSELENSLLAVNDISPFMKMAMVPIPAAAETNPEIEIMKENIYPDAEIELVRNGSELWLVWTEDNPERSSMNRTQLMYSVFKEGSWSEPEWMGEDGTADFSPAASSTGDGVLMAWQNIKKIMTEDAGIGEFIKNAEISVTDSVYKADSGDVGIVTLTNDNKFDHSPKLAADGGNALLTWIKTDQEGTGNNDSLLYSSWNGSSWSSPEVITDSLPGSVIDPSLTMHGDKGLLLYTLNVSDGGQEIFAKVYDGDFWGGEVKITENIDHGDLITNPRAVYSNEEWFITWYQGDSIMYKEGLSGEITTEGFLQKVQSNYKICINEGEKPQIALVYQKIGEGNVQNLSTSFYDIEKGVWSDEAALTEGEGFIRFFSPVFAEDGKLNIAYTQAEIITEVIDGMEVKRPGDKVDLYTMTYTPVHDLALDEDNGLKLSPEMPLPGINVKVAVNVQNKGDFPENATVDLYDGNPEEGGTKIGEASTKQAIPARSLAELEIEWLPGFEERTKYHIYAVVHSDQGATEIDVTNNTINHEVTIVDLAVTNLEYELLGKDDYLITATVKNTGGRFLEGIEVYLDNVQSGEPLQTKELGRLEPGQELNMSFLISLDDLIEDENGEYTMSVTALPSAEIDEFNSDNNTYEFELGPASITVESLKPGQGEKHVGIGQPLVLSFNMDVQEGDQFDLIMLGDDLLNTIDINKELEGNTLTVTPQNPMRYDTHYTLIIPEGALENPYGHTMDGSYRLSFKTTTSSPEVVFSYPSDGFGNVALDIDISMQFNQNVLEEVAFDIIKLYAADSAETLAFSTLQEGKDEVPASVSLQDDRLNINPTEPLEENTVYRVLIPAGAVKNNMGGILQADYILEFRTEGDEDGGSEKGSGTSGTNVKQGDYKISRHTSEDGRTTATIYINRQSILGNGSFGKAVIINLTDEIAEDEIININLDAGALEQLVSGQRDLQIVTGKGDLLIPFGVIKTLFGEGENSISIIIAENNEMEAGNDRVSDGIIDFSIMSGDEFVTEFAEEVIVTLPLDMSKVGDARRVIVCVYDEITGKWQAVGGIADAGDGSITFETNHFSTYAAFETIKHFDDVTSDWAKEEVEIMASRRLINGVAENTFDPQGSITRAEFTALIVRSLYTELIESRGTFTDVAKDVWFADTVETAYTMDIIKGTGQNTFEPNAKISREQLAVIAYRFYNYKAGYETSAGSGKELADQQDISSWAREAVDFAAGTEIMIGSNGRFYPKQSTTRQEAAVVLYRLLEYMREI